MQSSSAQARVIVSRESIIIPTYEPGAPDKNPMFLDKRVYQGSSGKVYPLPFIDRIAEKKTDRAWDAVHLENEFVKLMILPEIGGRIHIGQDKTNGYDFFYRQNVIKPALVGLAGPWISGGVEFNWPQHHRPSTFMPANVEIEKHDDGSVTVWLSEHEPMNRMKGMHGVCLHPGKAFIEVKARVYNRTELPQTFLWWANVATRVHEQYQSFFPPDVYYVADHAKRSMSEFPLCTDFYYGVNYGGRPKSGVPRAECPQNFVPPACRDKSAFAYPANDLSWYANIPVPTSYMCMGTSEDFFGGYDHAQQAGMIHIANHHVSPGKKQWTWGNHEFGYAWDRHLTDAGGPYIELMAGVYTDNQPDFSFLMPGETKTWSQFWYPIQKIGPAHKANIDAAVSLTITGKKIRVGVSASARFAKAIIKLENPHGEGWEWGADLEPGKPFVAECEQPKKKFIAEKTTLRVLVGDGREIISYTLGKPKKGEVPPPATEPPLPAEIANNDELYVTGLHLEQYRHATRRPENYWREALRRDTGDARCNNAMGLWFLRRGEFAEAELHFRRAVERLTLRNPNPRDGEPHYNLGLALRHLGRKKEAYAAFYKATWNHAWQSAGYQALAELDCRAGAWAEALDHLDRALRVNAENLRARNLRVMVLQKLDHNAEANSFLHETLALDPLDWWARWLRAENIACDTQTRLDLAFDFARVGFFSEAIRLLQKAKPDPGTEPLLGYCLGWLHEQCGDQKSALADYRAAAKASPDYCFPARLEEIAILQAAMSANPRDARVPYYLGNLFYDRGRREEAISLWEKSAKLDAKFSIVWRNLGIAYFNVAKKPAKACAAYDQAMRMNPRDARLLYERDQLWKRLGKPPRQRLRELEKYAAFVRQRDDLCVELCALYNESRQHQKALTLLSARYFQPWEGGEGQALAQHVQTHLALGREWLAKGDSAKASGHFQSALSAPRNLGEAKHLLTNQSDIHYWAGMACEALGDNAGAKKHWQEAANFRGDFQQMSVKPFSEMTYYSALSLERLGRKSAANKLLRCLLAYAKKLVRMPAKIDYFATSLPTMLVFDDDLQKRRDATAAFMAAQARAGLKIIAGPKSGKANVAVRTRRKRA